jgi:4-nitrophenyl phosphatase
VGALGGRIALLTGSPRGLIVDMDGVLYRGERPMPGLSDFFSLIRKRPFVFLTNNSTVSALDCAAKLGRMGVEVAPAAILTVADATSRYLAEDGRRGSRALVLGSPALKDAVARAGLELVAEGKPAEVVVMGLDRSFTYAALSHVVHLLANGAAFVATSLDPVLLTESGAVPGTGALVAAVRACVPATPVCVGKPSAAIFEMASAMLGVAPEESLVVGDNLASDIAGGAAAGSRTALLLSGVTVTHDEGTHSYGTDSYGTHNDGTHNDRLGSVTPDFVFPGLPELSDFLRQSWAH